MPTYEMPVLFRIMSKADTAAALKRTAQSIFEKGGFIRKLENLGKRKIPFKVKKHEHIFKEANTFLFYFDAPPMSLSTINEEYCRDVDIIKRQIFKQSEKEEYECQLHEETLPAPYRKDVQNMIQLAKRKQEKLTKQHFKPNTGLDYYPFQH